MAATALIALIACRADTAVSVTPSIGVRLGPDALLVAPGETRSVTVTVSCDGGYAGDVALSLAGAPPSVTWALDPPLVSSCEASSELTLAVNESAWPGTYALTLTGTGEGVARRSTSLALTVTMPPSLFTLEFIPSEDDEFVWVVQGESWTWEGVNVTRDAGYDGVVDLSIEGLPPYITATLDPASLDASTTTSAVTFSAAADAPVGNIDLAIRGRGAGSPDAMTVFRFVVFPPGW